MLSVSLIWVLMREYLAVIFCGIAGTFLYNYFSLVNFWQEAMYFSASFLFLESGYSLMKP